MKVNQPKKKAYFYLKMMKNGTFFLVFLKKVTYNDFKLW